jgi:hypothetical protein
LERGVLLHARLRRHIHSFSPPPEAQASTPAWGATPLHGCASGYALNDGVRSFNPQPEAQARLGVVSSTRLNELN